MTHPWEKPPVQLTPKPDYNEIPAFLKREGGLYTLGDAHAAARTFIEEGGRRELEGSKAGKKGASRRRATLAKGARRKSPT